MAEKVKNNGQDLAKNVNPEANFTPEIPNNWKDTKNSLEGRDEELGTGKEVKIQETHENVNEGNAENQRGIIGRSGKAGDQTKTNVFEQ